MADSTIKNLTEKTSLGPTDLLVAWDSSAAETKKCKPSALDAQIFSKTQKPATTTGASKDLMVVSYDSNNVPAIERLPYNTAKSDIGASLNGANLTAGSVPNAALAGGITSDKLATIPVSKIENDMNLTGKTVTLPSNIVIPASTVNAAALQANAVSTEKIADASVTSAKLAANAVTPAALKNGGLEVASAWGVLSCDLVAGTAVEIPVGSSMALTKTTGFQNRVTVTFTGTTHSLRVGDWVCFANTVLTPTTNSNYDAYAWSPTVAAHANSLWVNDVVTGADVNATQLTPGQRYVIKSVGTTNWAPAGASFNREGDVFVANSTVLTGTGVAQVVSSYTVGIWPVVSINGSIAFDFETLQTVPNGIALPDFILRPVRIQRGLNIKKVGRIFQGRFRIYWETPFSSSLYPVIPTAQSAKDVVVSAGTVRSTTTYTDITCGTVVPDEMRFVTFG